MRQKVENKEADKNYSTLVNAPNKVKENAQTGWIKEETSYFSGDMAEVIEEKESVRDLGIMMQNDATFSLQI